MSQEEAINPYQAPDQAAVVDPIASSEPAPLKDPRLRGWIAITGVTSFLLLCLVGLFQPEDGSWKWLERASLIVALFTFIAYLCWLFRCAANTRILDRHDPTSPSWAMWSHFIPILNWFGPCMVLRGVAKATFKHRPSKVLDTLIIVWWIGFLIRMLLAGALESIPAALIWLLLTLTTAGLSIYIILRVGWAQAKFRWSDLPESQRPNLVPLGSRPSAISPAAPLGSTAATPPMRPNIPPPRRPVPPPSSAEVSPPPLPDAESS